MPSLTKIIEEYINDLFQENEEEMVSLRRKDLAERFGCVPSQINYVLRSRFTPEKGYIVESQRGGHGFIRIARITFSLPQERVNHVEDLVGKVITEQETRNLMRSFQERGFISNRERLLVEVALRFQEETCQSLFDLSPYKRDMLRAELLKRFLRSLILA